MIRISLLVALLAIGVTGCATSYQPVGEGHTGPTAILRDTGVAETASKGQLFAATRIDDKPIDNAFGASLSASYGQGASLRIIEPMRHIPIRAMQVTLRGSHQTGAPIHAMASKMAGTYFSVEGVVEFTPAAGREYFVKGKLAKEASSVWIEDAETGEVVSQVVTR